MNYGSQYKYKIKTIDALRFWSSDHRCNKVKAIIAFSKDLEDANRNLRIAGYKNIFRKKALAGLGVFLNQPDMANVPFSTCAEKWWECSFKILGKGTYVKWKLDQDIDGQQGRAYFNTGDYLYVGTSGTVDGKAVLTQNHIYKYTGPTVANKAFKDIENKLVDQGVFDPKAEKWNIGSASELREFFTWIDPDQWNDDATWKES